MSTESKSDGATSRLWRVGARDAYLLGAYSTEASGPDEILKIIATIESQSNDRELALAVTALRATLKDSHELAHAPYGLAEAAEKNYLSIPVFQPSRKWLEQVRSVIEPVIEASGSRREYEIGHISGDLARTLFVLRALAKLRAVAPTNAQLNDEIASSLRSLQHNVERLRNCDFSAAAGALEVLDSRPEFLGKPAVDGHNEWVRAGMVALGRMGQQFVNELPVANAPPTQAEQDLYRQILREPARDDLRERYAQLARQRNDPRTKLIELQLTTRDLRRKGIPPGYGDLMRDASELIGANDEWTDTVVALGVDAVMHRGFVEEIHCDVDTFLARIDELISIAPILHVKFRGASGRVAEIAACPALRQLQSISFESNYITDADLAALASSQYVENLRWLDLGWNKITDAGVDALAAAKPKSLVCVNFGSNPCKDPTDIEVYYSETKFDWGPTPRGRELEATYGPLAWLHPSAPIWPPPMGIL